MCAKRSARWAFNFNTWDPSESDILLATSSIQIEEKFRIDKFVFKKDFKSSLIGRLLMRKFVHDVTGVAYNEIKFSRNQKGKPVLDFPNVCDVPICFNVSHQGDYAVLAGEYGSSQIGVDVMKLEYTGGKSLTEFFRIMNKNFTPFEWSNIRNGSCEQQISSFCRHWCLKESYVKAIGVGITINLQNISFDVKTKFLNTQSIVTDTELYVNQNKIDWHFEEMLLGPNNHCVAVALQSKSFVQSEENKFIELSFNEIIQDSIPLLDIDETYCKKYFEKPEKSF